MEKPVFNQRSGATPLLINKEDLFELIDIREPYFALKNIYIDDKNFATAEVPVEQPIGSEFIPISTAEACRHMGILGTVSCAHANPEKKKHYYLPHAGWFKRIKVETESLKTSSLTATAVCTHIDKKKAVAKTQLLDSKNNIICETEVFYHIVPEPVFKRLFYINEVKTPDYSIDNPYKLKNELFDIRLTTTNLTASLGKLPQKYCAGHFPKFPALPVPIVLYNLIDLAGLFIYHTTRDYRLKFIVKDFTLTSDNLAFAGEKVDLEIKHMHSFDNLFVLSAIATVNGSKCAADVKITIEGYK